jgi:hypothetical protein
LLYKTTNYDQSRGSWKPINLVKITLFFSMDMWISCK